MPRTVYEYKRIKTPVSDQKTLRDAGYTPFFSSNVSAGQRDGTDLYIRFHNGSVYVYPNKGDRFGDLLLSPSKGKWVWSNLRRTNASFSKVGGFPLSGDVDLTDEELFNRVKDSKVVSNLIKLIGEQETTIDKSLLGVINASTLSTILNRNILLTSGLIASNVANLI